MTLVLDTITVTLVITFFGVSFWSSRTVETAEFRLDKTPGFSSQILFLEFSVVCLLLRSSFQRCDQTLIIRIYVFLLKVNFISSIPVKNFYSPGENSFSTHLSVFHSTSVTFVIKPVIVYRTILFDPMSHISS